MSGFTEKPTRKIKKIGLWLGLESGTFWIPAEMLSFRRTSTPASTVTPTTKYESIFVISRKPSTTPNIFLFQNVGHLYYTISPHSLHVNPGTCRIRGPAFIYSSKKKKFAAKFFSQCSKTSFVSWSLQKFWQAKNLLTCINQVTVTCCKVEYSIENVQKLARLTICAPTWLIAEKISPAVFEKPTPFPHIPLVQCSFVINFKNLPVGFRQAKNFASEKIITGRSSQVAGF